MASIGVMPISSRTIVIRVIKYILSFMCMALCLLLIGLFIKIVIGSPRFDVNLGLPIGLMLRRLNDLNYEFFYFL
jgi:ABC-type multidrug transport system permease subunit